MRDIGVVLLYLILISGVDACSKMAVHQMYKVGDHSQSEKNDSIIPIPIHPTPEEPSDNTTPNFLYDGKSDATIQTQDEDAITIVVIIVGGVVVLVIMAVCVWCCILSVCRKSGPKSAKSHVKKHMILQTDKK